MVMVAKFVYIYHSFQYCTTVVYIYFQVSIFYKGEHSLQMIGPILRWKLFAFACCEIGFRTPHQKTAMSFAPASSYYVEVNKTPSCIIFHSLCPRCDTILLNFFYTLYSKKIQSYVFIEVFCLATCMMNQHWLSRKIIYGTMRSVWELSWSS